MAQHSVGATLSMVGSLPSHALGMMVFIGQHLATPNEASPPFAIDLRISSILTSADVIVNGCIMPFSTSALLVIPPQRRYPDHPPLMVKGILYLQ